MYELRSSYYENDGAGNFKRKLLPVIAQSSTIHDIATDDFDNDGFIDMLIVGNTYEINTQLGRMDAMHGLILRNDRKGGFQWSAEQNIDIKGAARTIKKVSINGSPHFIIGINNWIKLIKKIRQIHSPDISTLDLRIIKEKLK